MRISGMSREVLSRSGEFQQLRQTHYGEYMLVADIHIPLSHESGIHNIRKYHLMLFNFLLNKL